MRTWTSALTRVAASAALILAIIPLGGWRGEYTSDDTLAALSTASARAACVVGVETGHTYDPNVVGAAGEMGPAQLHPRGLYPDFLARGYTDPFDPYQAIPYLDQKLAEGEGWNWTPILYGMC